MAEPLRITGDLFMPGPLPYAGGAADQPAALMDAFALLDWGEAQLKASKRE